MALQRNCCVQISCFSALRLPPNQGVGLSIFHPLNFGSEAPNIARAQSSESVSIASAHFLMRAPLPRCARC